MWFTAEGRFVMASGNALYFEYKCNFGRKGEEEIVVNSDWCPKEEDKPLLVVGCGDGTLTRFHDEGEKVGIESKRSAPPTKIAWGPAPNFFLAAGWHDGAITLWDEKNTMPREDKSVHNNHSITVLKWSPNGERLVSGDDDGTVAVWKIIDKGRLVCQCSIRKNKVSISHVVFRSRDSRTLMGEQPPCFYFSGEDGIIYFATDDPSRCKEIHKMDGMDGSPSGTSVLQYFAEKDEVVGINDHVIMTRLKGPDDAGNTTIITTAKLSAKAGDRMLALWAAPGLLVTSSNESMIRFWNLAEDENYVVRITEVKVPPDDRITAIAFSHHKRVLAAGTNYGYVLFWFLGTDKASSSAEDWIPLHHATIRLGPAAIADLKWAPPAGGGLLYAGTEQNGYILIEHELQRKVRDGVALVQESNQRVGFLYAVRQRDATGVAEMDLESEEVQRFWAGEACKPLAVLTATIPIKGCDVTRTKAVVWSGRMAEVYTVDAPGGTSSALSKFETKHVTNMVIGSEAQGGADATPVSLYMAVLSGPGQGWIEVTNLQGVVTKTLALGEAEGVPRCLDINGVYLAASTSRGMLRMWDVTKRDPKETLRARKFEEGGKGLGEITSIRVNANGTRVSVLCKCAATNNKAPSGSVYVYEMESDAFWSYDCGPLHYPVNHAWDASDPRLLGCETRRKLESRPAGGDEMVNTHVSAAEVVTLFATDRGLFLQDRFGLPEESASLLGLHVPSVFTCVRGTDSAAAASSSSLQVRARVMRDFVGMEKVNEEGRRALVEFSYNLTLGNMDEAYKAVKLIKSTSVWENMAHMCVKTHRLDVAEMCLGQMGNARGARAVKEAKAEPEPEARIAMVAIQLGLFDDAERLYMSCGRYDLLNKMYQASGQWEKAEEIATKKDRMNLRSTYHSMGRYFEETGDVQRAVRCYEKAQTHRAEVPRMLFERGEMDQLERYVQGSEDKELFKWWAQFSESNGRLDAAMKYYLLAEDHLSIVRVHCFREKFKEAEELVLESGSAAAAYYLGTQYEALEKPREAIAMFTRAGRHNHGVRIAREHHLDAELLPLALQTSSQRVMRDCAKYLEGRGHKEQAVVLYQKAGDSGRALELCFSHKLFDSLRTIAEDLSGDTDPGMLGRVGDFFMSNSQYDKAVQILVAGHQVTQAMDLCERYKVPMTEDLAERITEKLEGGAGGGGGEDGAAPAAASAKAVEERNTILRRIADLCVQQHNYHLATKKYTQGGMKDKAMEALLKSGDTEKIIFFAGVLRSKDIYVKAANYLQTLNWHADAELLRKIIEFYTKAKAYAQLAAFYDACSQVEIDEFRDYDKALGALQESRKNLVKAGKDAADIDRRIECISAFVRAKAAVATDPAEFLRVCQQLLEPASSVDGAVQPGDVLAILIEFHYSQGDFQKAYAHVEQMRRRRIPTGPYLDQEMLQTICRHVGAPLAAAGGGGGGGDDGDGAVDEDIVGDS